MNGLNILLQSFHINNDIIGQNDKIRVSITTIPEDNKQAFVIDAKKMSNAHHFFSFNINKFTEKIVFVFRKKSFLQNDPIIASTIIHSNEFPKSKDDLINDQIKSFNIYEPISNIHDRKNQMKGANRRIVGQMEIQMSLDDAFQMMDYNCKYQTHKTLNKKGYSNMNTNNNENILQANNIMFVDNGL